LNDPESSRSPRQILQEIDAVRDQFGEGFRDEMVADLYRHAESIADRVVDARRRRTTLDETIDRIVTHPIWAWPIMLVVLAVVFWITVAGANVPSALLAGLLIDEGGLTGWLDQFFGVAAPAWLSMSGYELLHLAAETIGAPLWMRGLMIDGVYLCLAWVVSVMLPPMAIFFPLFTLLEDLGYLPRVAFNMDWLFKAVGAHGKQALTMAMGYGCNAAGVTACRIIDSPREKLIAVMTNNFMICNGRFPTVIAISTIMVAGGVSSAWLTGTVAAAGVIGVVLLGIVFMFLTSWVLSRTVLRGEASAFTLELPPYRRPSVLRIFYTSLIDRTIFVLGRACLVAAPAGALIWLVANVEIGNAPIAAYLVNWLGPVGWFMGLSGVVVLAYIIAIPANEIVVPTVIMLMILTGSDAGLEVARGRMIEPGDDYLATILAANGWTMLTSVSLLLFCLLHNPCGTTIWTIWRETRSLKWTAMATLMPVAMGVAVCAGVAAIWRALA
jgi:ferrous iron transport protein B